MPGAPTRFAAHQIPLHTPALLCALALGVGGHALASSVPAGSVAGDMEVGLVFEACLLGNAAVVSEWLDRGGEASPTYDDGPWVTTRRPQLQHRRAWSGVRGMTLLAAAAGEGHAHVVELLLQRGAEVGAQTSEGHTALLYAADNGHEQTAAVLIRHGAEINQQDSEGNTALTYACNSAQPWALRMVDYLLSKGADVNHLNLNGEAALMLAAAVGEERVVELLIHYGAVVDMQDAKGNSALMDASSAGRVPVVHALLRAGAQVELQNGEGLTAVRFAEDLGCAACAQALKDATKHDALPLVPDADGAADGWWGYGPPMLVQWCLGFLSFCVGLLILNATYDYADLRELRVAMGMGARRADAKHSERTADAKHSRRAAKAEARRAAKAAARKAAEAAQRQVADMAKREAAAKAAAAAAAAAATAAAEAEAEAAAEAAAERDTQAAEEDAVDVQTVAATAEELGLATEGVGDLLRRANLLEIEPQGSLREQAEVALAALIGVPLPPPTPSEAALSEYSAAEAASSDTGGAGTGVGLRDAEPASETRATPASIEPAISPSRGRGGRGRADRSVGVYSASPSSAEATPSDPPAAIVVSLAAATFDTGRPAVPESTLGGETTCIICFTRPKSHVAIPCGHLCACSSCSARMEQCPICRERVLTWTLLRVA